MASAETKERYSARAEAHAGTGVRVLGRLGIASMGIVYLVIGFLTVRFAVSARGEITDARDALNEIGSAPYGQVLLWLVAIGLILFAIFRVVGAIRDIDGLGNGAKGVIGRIGFAFGGLVYGFLGAGALGLVVGSGGGGSGGGGSKETAVAKLLTMPAGRWLVAVIGIVIIGYGVYQVVKAVKKSFFRKFEQERMSAREISLTSKLGTAGITARSVVLGIIGYFIIRAAITYNSEQAGGLADALAWLGSRPYGPYLLGLVALGLFLYGVYALFLAKYRSLGAPLKAHG
ncbi:MAG: DUF1206 domain-containing protein [Verrucomicrobiota bacterium]